MTDSIPCRRCGTVNRPGISFCANCGQRLVAAEADGFPVDKRQEQEYRCDGYPVEIEVLQRYPEGVGHRSLL